MASPPSAVANTIEVLRKRIEQIRERKEIIGEENTKATLIDPLLAALGWDLHEIDEVRREYRRKPQDNPVDYALFLNRTECLFIEAKSLEKDLADHRWVTQNLSYATAAGVQWCVLTNGDEYRIYNAHAPVAVEEKLFRSVRISETDREHLSCTLLLLSKEQMRGSLLEEMWKRHFVDKRVHQAIGSLLAEEDGSLVRVIQKKARALSAADIRASLKRARIQIDFPIPAITLGTAKVERGAAQAPKQKISTSQSEAAKKAWGTIRAGAEATLENLIAAGLVRPPLELERDYKGVHLVAIIQQNGKVEFAGEQYDSLSTAAGMARKTVIGSPPDRPYPQTNGWTFWQYRDRETGELRQMDHLRQQYLAARK
ncbi:MAG: type I restriction enzyme HsdR N-terminal domain-containing protein [Bryobacteraceae bacterium]|nr:type I restriction enzyme HsdR N-terminal domain-containing protein [Bryobacteraceae bacterium]